MTTRKIKLDLFNLDCELVETDDDVIISIPNDFDFNTEDIDFNFSTISDDEKRILLCIK